MTRHTDVPLLACALLLCGSPFLGCTNLVEPDGGGGGGGTYPLWSADPLSGANPFPDPRLLGTDGGLSSRPRFWEPFMPPSVETAGGTAFEIFMTELGGGLAPMTGFGNYGAILVPFSAGVDPTSLAAATSYLAISGNGSLGSIGPNAAVVYHADLGFAEIHPVLPLQPGKSYQLVLTDAAKDIAGVDLVRSPDFAAFASSSAGQSLVSLAAQILGSTPNHVVFAMQFQTESTGELQSLAAKVQPAPTGPYTVDLPPSPVPLTACDGTANPEVQCPRGVFTRDAGTLDELSLWFTTSPFDGGSGYQDPPIDVGMVVAGGVSLKDVRDSETGTFQQAAVADPFGAGRDVVREFVLVTPDPARMPDGGWPMVLVGHGLGQRNTLWLDSSGKPEFSECVMLAEFFAKAGFGCIGIDAPSHGTRGIWAGFFDFSDLLATRDNLREMTFDQMQLQRFAASWPAGNLGITIDPNRLTYFGVSLGGIMGGSFMSLDPRTSHGVLNVPGGGLYQIFESPNILNELGLVLAQVNLGIPFTNPYDGGVNPDFAASLPFLESAAQVILEPGDSINNATLFADAGSRHVLMQEGLLDRTVPNRTTDSLAAALGVPALQAATTTTADVSGLWKYDLTHYGLDPTKVDPHSLFYVVPQARDQAAHYLMSAGTDIVSE